MSLRRLRPPLLGAPAAGELLMKERVDYVALSLLPINWWRDVAAELRAGNSPASVLQQLTENTVAASTSQAR